MNYNDWYFSKYTHIDPSFYAFGEMAWQAAQAAAKKHQCQPVCVFHEGNEIARLQAENVELRKNYNELIMSVGRKFPDETRHQTALRYIQTTETQCIEGPASAAMKEGK